MNTTTIGLDIAKTVFQVHGVDACGKTTLQRAVALANKLARIMWALLVHDREYRVNYHDRPANTMA
jgi:transposase